MTSVHPPFDVRIFHKEIKSLVRDGFEVSLIAPSGGEGETDVRIVELDCSKSRLSRMSKTVFSVFIQALKQKSDIYHFHDPELIPCGFTLKLLGKRVIYDVHEDLPRQIVGKKWIPGLLKGPLSGVAGLMEWFGGRFFSGVVAATPTIGDRFPVGKTEVVQNFPDLNEFNNFESVPYADREDTIVYVGGLAEIRGIYEMVSAIGASSQKKCRLKLAGGLPSVEISTKIADIPGNEKTDFLGWKNRDEIASLLGESKVGLVLLHPIENYKMSFPIKLFEYMAAGIPVVVSDFDLWRDIIEGAQCGLLVDPLDVSAVTEAIDWMLEHPVEAAEMGRRGRVAVEEKYNWANEEKKLFSLYTDILEN
ncbi:glycosyltransferase family 4 protein [Deltaproteobacteria bacterium]|nr:glycosyltransferase family 4 protein [Deltaproteobacteria bacterium]